MRLFILSLLMLSPLLGEEKAATLPEPEHLLVNNRILAKVNGKTISVVDVVKKMDLFLNRAYPQYAQSKMARFQFYTTQWRNTLTQMIDNELMLADAEGIELKISDGEVRETLQERFGPNVLSNLEKIGISYEEAREIIHSELMVQRMNWYRIHSKAYLSVNPQDIKVAYREYCEKNPPDDEWKYQVLSIRGGDQATLSHAVERVETLRNDPEASLQQIYDALQNEESDSQATLSLSLSPVYELSSKKLSLAHKEALASLEPGTISPPISQTSRDGTMLFRLFYLKEHVKRELPPFEKMADNLHDELVEKAVGRETGRYLAKLRQRYSFDEKDFQASVPPDFQPFAIQ